MIIGIGTDILDIRRIEALVEKHPYKFAARILTPAEVSMKDVHQPLWLAKRFAAKEAVSKACGTGISASLSFQDIDIANNNLGKPVVTLSQAAQNALQALYSLAYHIKVHLSLSDEPPYVLAYAIAETDT